MQVEANPIKIINIHADSAAGRDGRSVTFALESGQPTGGWVGVAMWPARSSYLTDGVELPA